MEYERLLPRHVRQRHDRRISRHVLRATADCTRYLITDGHGPTGRWRATNADNPAHKRLLREENGVVFRREKRYHPPRPGDRHGEGLRTPALRQMVRAYAHNSPTAPLPPSGFVLGWKAGIGPDRWSRPESSDYRRSRLGSPKLITLEPCGDLRRRPVHRPIHHSGVLECAFAEHPDRHESRAEVAVDWLERRLPLQVCLLRARPVPSPGRRGRIATPSPPGCQGRVELLAAVAVIKPEPQSAFVVNRKVSKTTRRPRFRAGPGSLTQPELRMVVAQRVVFAESAVSRAAIR